MYLCYYYWQVCQTGQNYLTHPMKYEQILSKNFQGLSVLVVENSLG